MGPAEGSLSFYEANGQIGFLSITSMARWNGNDQGMNVRIRVVTELMWSGAPTLQLMLRGDVTEAGAFFL